MVQCESIFLGVLAWLLSSQQVLLVEVLLLPLTWRRPHSCLLVEFALLEDLQEVLNFILNRMDHIFDRSIGNSDPIMRTVFVLGLDSNFTSILQVLKTGRHFQYRTNPHISLNPSFRLRSWIVSRQSVFATSH